MIGIMNPRKVDDNDIQIIEVNPRRTFHWKRWVIALVVIVFLGASRGLSVFLSATWFKSLGFESVYWYILEIKFALFAIFALSTFAILRVAFWLLARTVDTSLTKPRSLIVNNQQISLAPARVIRIASWVISALIGLIYGLSIRDSWKQFALYLNQTAGNVVEPVLGRSIGFYLFTLPVYDTISGWLLFLSIVVLLVAIGFSVFSMFGNEGAQPESLSPSIARFPSISVTASLLFLTVAAKVYLSRYPLLWEDHQAFSGVTYTEAHYVIPGLTAVSISLIIASALCLINAFWTKRVSVLGGAIVLPVIVFLAGCVFIPSYVTSFVVKPNELGRETPFIEANIAATRRAFKLDRLELRNFDAEPMIDAAELAANRPTLDNVRLWDWRALQDTLRQTQEIRTYYDFTDVDVDRYVVGGQTRQMMVAARELDVNKLPEQSRNWVNERLIYTHGYGVTMNTSNGFTPEGLPVFVLSNMPVESTAPEIKVTRPEIYFGQKTDTDVYVNTRQKEFDFPQGETNSYSTYSGNGGIPLGSGIRKTLLAAALGDLTKIPFSDAIIPETRALIHRNIRERVNSIAPFLIYDNDPYIVVTSDGRLVWMIDAFTESSTYPYSRHYIAADHEVNYIRNSVKVTIDAYNGTVTFYIFDSEDPIIETYKNVFPALFHDASEMPADLRAHIRYPETLFRVQGDVFSLYHTQNAKMFFQREDIWSVANKAGNGRDQKPQQAPVDPYFVLMQLPGEDRPNEFAEILPFTPANRNNMIGWMAGRSDGDAYGSLLVYNFPKSRLVDGPLQVEARIDQNAQLSGQFTLWNQQGSRVQRGNLLVIPIGKSLLYVEPIYLKAESSPMPELRLVVLATQEKLAYGLNYQEALTNLFGQQAKQPESPGQPGQESQTGKQPANETKVQSTQDLIHQAASDLSEYRKLTSEGKFGEAGQKLESATRALEELNKTAGKP